MLDTLSLTPSQVHLRILVEYQHQAFLDLGLWVEAKVIQFLQQAGRELQHRHSAKVKHQ
jgi:hypothetical protein